MDYIAGKVVPSAIFVIPLWKRLVALGYYSTNIIGKFMESLEEVLCPFGKNATELEMVHFNRICISGY